MARTELNRLVAVLVGVAAVTANQSTTGAQDAQDSEDGSWISYTFEKIDPELFNQIAELFGTVAGWIYGVAIAGIYGSIMTWHLRRGNSIPASELGNIPGDTFESLLLGWSLKSFPAVVLVLLLGIGDFSKTVALEGLTFPLVRQEGPEDTVLSLATMDRNSQRLPQTAGDPPSLRSVAIPDIFYDFLALNDTEVLGAYQSFQDLIHGYLDAADLVARGASPLTNSTTPQIRESTNYYGVGTEMRANRDYGPVVSMDMQIPLLCDSSSMVPVNLSQSKTSSREPSIQYQSLVANCSFSQVRQSGILEETADKIEILEFATNQVENRDKVYLSDGSNLFRKFDTTKQFRELARDKADWKRGRDVSFLIKGVRYGDKHFPLQTAVVATGSPSVPNFHFIDNNSVLGWEHVNNHIVVGHFAEECPPRPSGGSMEDTYGRTVSCLAFMELTCDSFPEDHESVKLGIPSMNLGAVYLGKSNPSCTFYDFSIVWGNNFDVDEELVSVVAGVYGRVRPNSFVSAFAPLDFFFHSIPAALFAMGTLDTEPSLKLVVRPRINGLFIFFMFFPLMIGLALYLAVRLTAERRSPIPEDPLDLLCLAREELLVPTRDSKDEMYPREEAKNFQLEGIASTNHKLAVHLVPVPPTKDGKLSNNGGHYPQARPERAPQAMDPLGRHQDESVIVADTRGEAFKI